MAEQEQQDPQSKSEAKSKHETSSDESNFFLAVKEAFRGQIGLSQVIVLVTTALGAISIFTDLPKAISSAVIICSITWFFLLRLKRFYPAKQSVLVLGVIWTAFLLGLAAIYTVHRGNSNLNEKREIINVAPKTVPSTPPKDIRQTAGSCAANINGSDNKIGDICKDSTIPQNK